MNGIEPNAPVSRGSPSSAWPRRGSPDPLLAWLQSDAVTYRETPPFLEAFGERLLQAGFELGRVTTGIHILHPQIDAASCLWKPGLPVIERRFRLDETGTRSFSNSPMPAVYRGERVRRRLEGPPEAGEFPILTELRAAGMTDYLALPLPFSDGSWKGVTYAADRRGGFTDRQVARLASLVPALARILEIQTLHRTAQTLLDTYVGPTAGRRVLQGAIKRGMCDPIDAVIWLCDLRGFTAQAEALPGRDVVRLLDEYFGAMTDAVAGQGGEVLKFIGDAMLAIFPLAGEDLAEVAARALQAAGDASTAVDVLNERRAAQGQPVIRYGLALHLGEVLYGNIGGERRLDFTVIGRAVNIAARIEALCRTLDRRVLLSGDLAGHCGDRTVFLGTFPLRGVGADQPVHGLREER